MYRFGAFQVDPRAHELRRSGIRIKVQEQAFVVLLKLLERPGELVTREELRSVIWPADTFVDFDAGLNTVIMRLREVLRDSAEVPRFIETVPKLGYRFIAPVESVDSRSATATQVLKQHRIPMWARWAAAAVIFLAICAAAFLSLRRTESWSGASVEVVPLTGMPGMESDPAFSPDGNQVAFKLSRVPADQEGIYTTVVGGERALQLTSDPADCCPYWSPDGRSIAFARERPGGYTIYLLSALGGTPRKLYSSDGESPQHLHMPPHFSWSPDGKYLAVSALQNKENRPAITLVSVADSSARPLILPPPEYSDWYPAFSPDGKFIAFLRSSGPGMVEDVYVVPATGGEPRRLTFDKRQIQDAPVWTADNREIIFSSIRAGPTSLWRVPASGGTPKRVEGMGTSAITPAVALKGNRLAYVNSSATFGLEVLRLTDPKHAAGPPRLIGGTKRFVGMSYFSPDARKIAFESDRSGYDEIWTTEISSNPTQLTFLSGESGSPRWSYDGRLIAFDYWPGEHSEIYVVEVPGGSPRVVPTIPGADNVVPSWSHDGNWLYFSSNRGDEPTQVWKMSYPDGNPIQLTKNGGLGALESTDGFVYYGKALNTDEIWKVLATGGKELLVLKTAGLYCCGWALAPTGIYFIAEGSPGVFTLSFHEFLSRKTSTVATIPKPAYNPAVSPDGKWLSYSQLAGDDRTIMLVNHFR